MAALLRLALTNVRRIESCEIEPGAAVNVFWGDNGSGKTSLLEGVFLLGRGRSFRTSQVRRVVTRGKDGLSVVGTVLQAPGGQLPCGLSWDGSGCRIRIGGQAARSTAELARVLPLQLMDAASHLLVEGGPQHRRRFLDLGVFHVEPGFHRAWKDFSRILEQRNALLRQQPARRAVTAWDRELGPVGEELDRCRARYFQSFLGWFARFAAIFFPDAPLTVEYVRGWARDVGYLETLDRRFDDDCRLGYTFAGPQRAELVVRWNTTLAREVVSRGQQKLLAATLVLAQAGRLAEGSARNFLFLIDDLAAELDRDHLRLMLGLLGRLGAQIFLTATHPDQLPFPATATPPRMFHVEHGTVKDLRTEV